jgi:hypothetical protein
MLLRQAPLAATTVRLNAGVSSGSVLAGCYRRGGGAAGMKNSDREELPGVINDRAHRVVLDSDLWRTSRG